MRTDATNTSQLASTTFAVSESSDDRIATQALRALERENITPGRRIAVAVERGWLTLSGRASHPVERAAAECVVRYVAGVRGVTNRLVIAHADRQPPP